jgi:hypothetical protein
MYYIGLDVSTSCVGVCALDNSGQIIKITHCYLGDIEGLVNKGKHLEGFLSEFRDSLPKLFDEPQFEVSIEEAAQMFKRGMSSAGVISLLNQINGLAQFLAFNIFFKEPVMISAINSRTQVGLKVVPEKKCSISTKEQVRSFFEKRTGMQLSSKTLKSGPRKGMIVFDERNYDSMDAWVIAESLRVSKNGNYNGHTKNKLPRKISRKKIRS